MKATEDTRIAVVDVETTGLSPWRNDRIVEIAVVLMLADGTIQKEYETLVNPDRDLGPSRIHHITAREILLAPSFIDIAGDIADLLSQAYILAGHNVSFDKQFLIKEYQRMGVAMPDIPTLCTYQLLGRNNLASCCSELDVEFEGTPHRAISDARTTAKLVQRIISDEPDILSSYKGSRAKWPPIKPKKTKTVSRDHAQIKLQEPPRFLQRILSRVHHDTEAEAPDIVEYLALIDRVLEDRVIDVHEENALVDAVVNWGLSPTQVENAHRMYIHNLAVQALVNGHVTDAERNDLYHVATLLGLDERDVDDMLRGAAEQLRQQPSRIADRSITEDLRGSRVCFTGEIQSRINGTPISRDIAEALAEQAGLTVANSVTKMVDLLVVADPNTQSSKAKKARQYGKRIVSDRVFWRLIGVVVD